MALVFSPCIPGEPYVTHDPHTVVLAVAAADAGNWVYKSDKPEAEEAVAAAKRRLFDALSAGRLSAYVYLSNPHRFYRIPTGYWQQGPFWDLRLTSTLWGFALDGTPPEYLNQPVVFVESEVEAYLKHQIKNVVRRGPKSKYPWADFEAEAVNKLDYEGGFSEAFCKADLMRHMESWCESHWERTPGETSIKEHIEAAHQRFLEMRASL
jgi:hypothetical protein